VITNEKVDWEAKSKIGSLQNIKHKPQGGDVQVFEDIAYLNSSISCLWNVCVELTVLK
jgi:hypothetical protein